MKHFPHCVCRTWGFNAWKVTKTKWGMKYTCPICGRLWGFLTPSEHDNQRELRAIDKNERGSKRT